jgi:hypothetical protein
VVGWISFENVGEERRTQGHVVALERWTAGGAVAGLVPRVICPAVLYRRLALLLHWSILVGLNQFVRSSFSIRVFKVNPVELLRFQYSFVSKGEIATGIIASLLAQFLLDSPLVFEYMVCDHVSVSVKSAIGVTISGMDKLNRVLMIAMCCFLLAFAR